VKKRHILGLILFIAGILIWFTSSDVVELIVRQRPVLLGRYSQGHFGSLFFLTLIFWIAAGVISTAKYERWYQAIGPLLLVYCSTFGSLAFLVLASGWMAQPRYIETKVEQKVEQAEANKQGDTNQEAQPTQPKEQALQLSGIVRHRPPNKFYEYTEVDKPVEARSYPDAPAGYPSHPITLTTDQYGFRNQNLLEQYPIVAVGDSFTVGSHVSDDQGWTELLSNNLQQPIYNLGVSGSDPDTYLNNFATLGRQFSPKTVLVMIYEGNDFRYSSPVANPLASQAKNSNKAESPTDAPENKQAKESAGAKKAKQEKEKIDWKKMAKGSPVTKGLKRFSHEVLEPFGKDQPVPAYHQKQSWMPVQITHGDTEHYYSFKPKRMLYLNVSKKKFSNDHDWQVPESMFNAFNYLAEQDGFRLIFIYAPSKPHVILPLVEDTVPAEQLLRFARYKKDSLKGPAEEFKAKLYKNLDNQESVFLDWCKNKSVECISLTKPLQEATENGQQTYYTYDQHWTPVGNQVAAETVRRYLAENPENP